MSELTEKQWEDTVSDTARTLGWKLAGFRAARTKDGWRTPVRHDAKGFPDLVMVRERLLFVELKTNRGRLSEEQYVWIDWLRDAGQEVYVWRPKDFNEMVSVLRRRVGDGNTAGFGGGPQGR